MPLKVVNKDGKQVGTVAWKIDVPVSKYLILLHGENNGPIIDRAAFQQRLANVMGAGKLLGGVNEKKLEAELEAFRTKGQRGLPEGLSRTAVEAYAFLALTQDQAGIRDIVTLPEEVNCFVMCDPSTANYHGDAILLEDVPTFDPDVIAEATAEHFLVHGHIERMPRYHTEVLGWIGSTAMEVGGYNHLHQTILSFCSGTVQRQVKFDRYVPCVKGQAFYLRIRKGYENYDVITGGGIHTISG